ncbi:ABC-F family ATP-binding cassette domain-containing protein [Clostridium oryzae]|uniref:Putative ABC transporter ATP-binding protein YjjK n=1 Tax=Clostridium oryzae TaxID=1450648 RepID=A0A1V4ICK6_9CLOT|nr:ABC-F family ATP-binding cassette domain-containing protein [Clostridium oryzae]OPJ57365.1 putative ABC transporter ATP-binding protein YjjK [Clostridium oryzae]
MNILNGENISKSYSERILFDKITLGINEGEKIGLIGVNGTGKSTLLKVLSGIEVPDEGKITVNNSVNISYLAQSPEFDNDSTVLEYIFKGESEVMRIVREYEKAIEAAVDNDEIIRLSRKMDEFNAWSLESQVKSVLSKLGINNFNQRLSEMSGGQRKRVAMASVLINPSELIIMDEPTNHLDNDTIEWLETFLNKRKGALIMITHDRYFLDRVTNRILELDNGKLYSYDGNYEYFLSKKIEREQIETAEQQKKSSLLKRELAWIRRGAKARSTKQKARIDRFEQLKEDQHYSSDETIEISSAATRLGKKIIELNHINKAFNDRIIISDFSYIVLRDDRIGIIGDNGTGKSTLMNIVAGKIKPDSGEVIIGDTVKIGMYSQEIEDMDNDLRVIEYIRNAAEWIEDKNGDKVSASQMLERFLFPPEQQWSIIGKLSGGEKRRLYLLKVLMEAPNVLLLDEPTNDLDIQTLEILEDYIDEFSGVVLAVSHDRYFLDRIAEKIFFVNNAKIEISHGNYSDFKDRYDKEMSEQKLKEIDAKKVRKPHQNDEEKKKNKPLKFSFKEKKEYEEIDEKISKLEGQIEELDKEIEASSSDYGKLQELLKLKDEAEKKLEEKMDRWVYLNELAEKIEEAKKQ